ncbi:AsmA family protein [Marimonas arenosa]|uniref:AsmA family protein n=1 Tax=Marimonas arenosa TaxID=1795305 RepID=A0AAE3WEA3_9RHOB|nr:AsmA family protein [Marimonas arenosa]MDQ2090137.1 AsmA family protein [Marimonas arenosa]
MRWIIRMAMALVVAAVLLLGLVLLLPGEKIAGVALEQIRQALGRDVRLDGKAEISLLPTLRVRTGAVTVANAEWSDSGPMLTAEGLLIAVETLPLLRGEIRVKSVELDAPVLLLERSRDGRANWDTKRGDASADGGGASEKAVQGIDKLELRNGKVTYADGVTGKLRVYSAVNASLSATDLRGRATLTLGFVTGEGKSAGAPVVVTSRIDGLRPFVEGGTVPIEATLSAAQGELRFVGRANIGGELAGEINAELPRTAAFAAALGVPGVAPGRGLGQQLTGGGKIVVTGGRKLALRDFQARLDHNRLTTDMDVDFGRDTPYVTARISAGELDFTRPQGDGGGAAQGQGGWSPDPIDAGILGLLDGQARLTLDSATFDGFRAGPSDIGITLERSRAVFALTQVAAYGGTLGGEFVINNRSGLSVGGKLTMRQVDAEAMLSDTAGITRLSGRFGGAVNFLGVGKSVQAIMDSLRGDGRMQMETGRISGIDLDRLMRSGEVTSGTTIFDTLTATFTLDGGNLRNDDLKMVLPNIEATGKGRVGLGARDIDYLLIPVALKARGGKGLAVPVRIRGPWSHPRYTPDMGAAVDLNLAEEKKALEDKAKAAVQEKLEKELGVETQEGQSLEDAIKQKAEEELLKGLQKLLE